MFRGYGLSLQGQWDEGIPALQRGIMISLMVGAKGYLAGAYDMLADSCARAGRIDEGLEAVAQGLALLEETGERGDEADLYINRGLLLLKRDDSQTVEIETCFCKAISIAQSQNAKWWELRATMSLARLLAKQNRRDKARAMLAEIYNWFTEGFDTADLKDAKALLDELKG